MPTYQYAARDERGGAVNGTLIAPDAEALAERLKRMGYLVTKSREVSESSPADHFAQLLHPIGYNDLVLFNVQLSTMVRVGIPLVMALDTLSQQVDNASLRLTIADVARNVEAGNGFSESLARHPRAFSPLFINMVRAGEVSGKLEEILRRLAAYAKHQADLREQLKTALTYPILLLLVGLSVITFLLLGIIPKFMSIFLAAGVPLPLPTLILYTLSQAVRRYGLAMLFLAAFGVVAAVRYVRTRSGRQRFDAFLLKLPVIGSLARKTALARFARTLETLLSSGVPALESLAIAERTCGNAVIAQAVAAAEASVRRGGAISDPLRLSHEFPPMVVQMISVGETSGTLDRMLTEVADHYDELVRHGIKRVTTLIEPLFLIVMGGLVALIMASVLLPLFRMVNVIR